MVYVGIVVMILSLIFIFRRRRKKGPPKSPTRLRLNLCQVRYNKMAAVNVLAKWSKSVSTDVVAQELTVFVNDEVVDVVSLGADVELFEVENVPENSTLKVELVASDGVFKSAAAVATLAIGDLTAPEAPTNLTLEIPPKV